MKILYHQTSHGNNAIPIEVSLWTFLGIVPAGDEAANMETVPGKLGHLVSQAKTACLVIQTSDLSFELGAPVAAEITLNWTTPTNEDIYSARRLFIQCTLTLCIRLISYNTSLTNFKSKSLIMYFITITIFLSPCAVCRRGGTDYVPGQKQAGQEACQCYPECGSSSSAGLLILH